MKDLIITVQARGNVIVELTFKDAITWSFSPFEEQNIIFDFRESKSQSFAESFNRYKIHQYYQNAVTNGLHSFYELESSAGMEGYVIASSLKFAELI